MSTPSSAADRTLGALRERGIRLTEPRRLVVEAAHRHASAFTADELLSELTAAHAGVGRATVFRTLDLLARQGVLDRLHQPDGCHSYIVATAAGAHHHHLICSGCGAVVQFEDCTVEPLLATLSRRTNFAISGHWLEVFGVCADCRG
jgi:Fur family ferric uptake transcriptional regulator